MKTTTVGETTIHNSTLYTPEQIAAQPVLFTVKNNWRQRNITVHEHPALPESVISVGVNFDGKMTVIADETREQWARQIAEVPWRQHFETN